MIISGLLINMAATAGAVFVIMAAAFLVAIRRERHDSIDIVWGLGFAVVALFTCFLATGGLAARIVTTALTVVWGLRLAAHIYRRNRGKSEDPRYVELLNRSHGNPLWYAFRTIYLTQGMILWFVSLPVQAAQYETGGFGPFGYLGVGVWLIGFVVEAVGDWQLARFKANPANKGKIMDRGLWRYTRHPNYFGDACVRWGVYLVACQHWIGALTILSPIAMTLFLVKGTGKALTEKNMGQRPGYAEYIAQTSGFFPLPPKHRDASIRPG